MKDRKVQLTGEGDGREREERGGSVRLPPLPSSHPSPLLPFSPSPIPGSDRFWSRPAGGGLNWKWGPNPEKVGGPEGWPPKGFGQFYLGQCYSGQVRLGAKKSNRGEKCSGQYLVVCVCGTSFCRTWGSPRGIVAADRGPLQEPFGLLWGRFVQAPVAYRSPARRFKTLTHLPLSPLCVCVW